MAKRKSKNNINSKRPTKQIRLVSSSDFDEEEQYASDCSSCAHDMFEQEQQSIARTARNRRRKAARNSQALRSRSVSTSSRRRGTRGRERHTAVSSTRTRPRCTPRRQNQEPADYRRTSTSRRRGTRGRERHTAVSPTRSRPRYTPRRQNQEPANYRRTSTSRRRGTRGRERRTAVSSTRTRPRCTPRRQNQEPPDYRRTSTSRRSGSRRREHRTAVPYTWTRPRCAPRRQNLSSNESSPLLVTNYMRRDKQKNRQALRRSSTSSCLARGEKRARGKIPRCESASSNSSTMQSPNLEGPESVVPEQFLLLYCEPESDTFTKNVSITGENFTNQESSNSEINKTDCCKSCGLQIEENKKDNQTRIKIRKVQVSLSEAQQEQPVSSVQVSQNNVESCIAIRDNEPETLIPAESEQPLETESQTNEEEELSFESLIELPEFDEDFFRVLLVRRDTESFVAALGVDLEASGDGPEIIDQRAMGILLDAGLRDLVQTETSSDEFETLNISNPDILNSQPYSGEEHQHFEDNDEDDGEDSEQNERNQTN